MENFKYSTLPNRLSLITIRDVGARVVTAQLSIRAGARYESQSERGLAHLLEHMLLRGTVSRPSAFAVSSVVDRVGAYLNALTDNMSVAFITQTTLEHIHEIFELVADVVQNPLLDTVTLQNEKKIILEEIQQAYETPRRRLWIEAVSQQFPQHPLSHFALGDADIIQSVTAQSLREYHARFLVSDRSVLVLVSALEHTEASAQVSRLFGNWTPGSVSVSEHAMVLSVPTSSYKYVAFPGKQFHLKFLFRGMPPVGIRSFLCADLLAAHLGLGHTSLLYQKLRHELGLVYSIKTESSWYPETPIVDISTQTTEPQMVTEEIFKAMRGGFESIRESSMSELKERYANVLIRRLSNPLAHVSFVAETCMVLGRPFLLQEVLREIADIPFGEFTAAWGKMAYGNITMTVLGPEDPHLNIPGVVGASRYK